MSNLGKRLLEARRRMTQDETQLNEWTTLRAVVTRPPEGLVTRAVKGAIASKVYQAAYHAVSPKQDVSIRKGKTGHINPRVSHPHPTHQAHVPSPGPAVAKTKPAPAIILVKIYST